MNQLKPKHWKALELLEEGDLSIKEIAQASGFGVVYLRELIEGHSKAGDLGQLFQSELRKITNRKNSTIKRVTKDAQQVAAELLLSELQKLKKKGNLTDTEQRRLVDINNSLTKAKPTVEIGTVSYSRGLQKEDLIHEFNRLTSIARSTLKRGRVSGARKRGQGLLPASSGPGDIIQEEPEAPLLRTESETGSVSQE